MKPWMILAGLCLTAAGWAEPSAQWTVYEGTMDGQRFPFIVLTQLDNGTIVSRTGVYLYEGEDHPHVGVFEGTWDSWKWTLSGRWRELLWVGDHLEDIMGGRSDLVITEKGVEGVRLVDGDDDHVYNFEIDQAPTEADSDIKAMFLSAYFKYRSWVRENGG